MKHVEHTGERGGVYRFVVGKPGGKRPPGKPEFKWENNVRIDLEEIVLEDVDWIDLAWDRDRWVAFVKAVMKFQIPQSAWCFFVG